MSAYEIRACRAAALAALTEAQEHLDVVCNAAQYDAATYAEVEAAEALVQRRAAQYRRWMFVA